MILGRRRLLQFFGTAPIAAKVAVDAEIGRLAGVKTSGLRDGWHQGVVEVGGGVPDSGRVADQMPYEDRFHRAQGWLRVTGIPDILREKIKRDCTRVTSLDPDIAAKRSWSMAVKVITQRERNIERAIESYTTNTTYHGVRRAMTKLLGFEWPF